MVSKVDNDKCLRCGGCVSVCRVVAIDLDETKGIKIDSKCTSCGICVTFCPVRALLLKK
ncbi:MAG: 4Fe-4S binding protein [Candidatus Aenigmarchaeota archaeon]|nr:4Fe-4S binding protein [Candidatus Aenigmarchaeota archaeon]